MLLVREFGPSLDGLHAQEFPGVIRQVALRDRQQPAQGFAVAGTVNLFWRIATEIYSLGEFQSLLHHSAR